VQPDTVPTGGPGGTAPPPVVAGSQFPTFRPVSVRLPSGRVTPVEPAGVRDDGSLAVPEQPTVLGWWTGGALAGEPFGGVVVAGHVDSRRLGIGALAEIRTARPGQTIALTGEGRSLTYRITSIRNVPQARLAAGTDVFAQDVPHRLVLITCGGPFNRSTHHYTENVVMLADPVRATG
jgi:hypothetical protein